MIKNDILIYILLLYSTIKKNLNFKRQLSYFRGLPTLKLNNVIELIILTYFILQCYIKSFLCSTLYQVLITHVYVDGI